MASLSQLSARLVDIFGPPASAVATKLLNNLGITPAGNVVIGAATSTDTSTNKLQVTGGIVANGYDTGSLAQFRMVQGNYGAMLRQDGTSVYLLSTPSGSQYGTWNSYRPWIFNMTTGAVQIVEDGSTLAIGGATTHSANVSLYSTGTYSPYLYLNANGYAPYIRSNSTASQLEFVNSANTALNVTISDGGVVSFPRARPNWAGVTPWDTGNLNPSSYMLLTGGTITGGLTVNGGITSYGVLTCTTTANLSYTTGTWSMFSNHAANQSSGYAAGNAQGSYMGWNDSNGGGEGMLCCNRGGGSGGWVLRTVNSNNSAEIGRYTISSTGTGTNGSDSRLKDNIETLSGSLDKIMQVRPVSYVYKADPAQKHMGVIAQEIQPVFPDVVTVTHNTEEHEDLLGVCYTDLIAPLVGAVQELSGKLDAAMKRIQTLEDQLKEKE
jgi:hypothetical protein